MKIQPIDVWTIGILFTTLMTLLTMCYRMYSPCEPTQPEPIHHTYIYTEKGKLIQSSINHTGPVFNPEVLKEQSK